MKLTKEEKQTLFELLSLATDFDMRALNEEILDNDKCYDRLITIHKKLRMDLRGY